MQANAVINFCSTYDTFLITNLMGSTVKRCQLSFCENICDDIKLVTVAWLNQTAKYSKIFQ